MEAMRESWTDERLDYFRAETAQRFDAVDQRFDVVDKRFDAVDRRFEAVDQRFDVVEQRLDRIEVGLRDLNGRFDALNRTLLQTGGGIIATLIAGIVSVVITQL
jgi:septation ring formation regulator EzrA